VTKVAHTDLRNRFGIGEWSGALGDLGTLLPLALALMISTGFPLGRMLFVWGLAYVLTGWFYRVPVSVQPLKAMAAIAIAGGFSPEQLSSTAVFYGAIMIVLSLTGAIAWLQRWFSPTLIRGVQLGIGLILVRRALAIVMESGLVLNTEAASPMANVGIMAAVSLVLYLALRRGKGAVPVLLILGGSAALALVVLPSGPMIAGGAPASFTLPGWSFFFPALFLLMIPQLPLTLGNAVFAASEASHSLWGARARRVTPTRLGLSIGLGNVAAGLLGGFPFCHGAGGMGAHARFGGRTGGTTIITGSILILCALTAPALAFLTSIPVPVLGAILLLTGWRMMVLVTELETRVEASVAILVGTISFVTRNLAVAVAVGLAVEGILVLYGKRIPVREGVED
jgi:SulP family sulfate permease